MIVNRKAKIVFRLGFSGIILILLAILYIAYVYQPQAVSNFKSQYLTTVHSRFLKTGKYKIHFIHSGNGKPVILIHGGGNWLYSYRDNFPVLSKKFSVYALDMPGHGYTKTLMDNPRYDLNTYCEFLLDFMNQQHIDKACLVGHSWGGGWALYFTEKHPERVDKLVLIDASGLSNHDVLEWEILKIPVLGETVSKFINRKTVQLSLQKVFFNKAKVDHTMVNELWLPLSLKENRQAQYLAERNLDWRITRSRLAGVATETLIIWGKNDNYLSYKEAFQFRKKIRNSKLLLLDHCGHEAHEERPDEVNKAIEDFCQQSSGR